jgi:hypothetical protein
MLVIVRIAFLLALLGLFRSFISQSSTRYTGTYYSTFFAMRDEFPKTIPSLKAWTTFTGLSFGKDLLEPTKESP